MKRNENVTELHISVQ